MHQGGRPQKKPSLPTPSSLTSGLQNGVENLASLNLHCKFPGEKSLMGPAQLDLEVDTCCQPSRTEGRLIAALLNTFKNTPAVYNVLIHHLPQLECLHHEDGGFFRVFFLSFWSAYSPLCSTAPSTVPGMQQALHKSLLHERRELHPGETSSGTDAL